jgi:hypothetical protein
MVTLVDSPFSAWQQVESEIIPRFLMGPASQLRLHDGCYFINDSLTIATLVTILDLKDYRGPPQKPDSIEQWRWDLWQQIDLAEKGPRNWVRDALSVLINETYFSALAPHSEEIKRRLKGCTEPEKEKVKLLALCRLNRSEEDALLAKSDLPVWIRARHGDEEAEAEIVEQLHLARVRGSYHRVHWWAGEACFAATPRCRRALLDLFNHDIREYRQRAPDRRADVYSAHDSLLTLVARWHPDEPLFQQRLYTLRTYWRPAKLQPYFKDLAVWVKKTYDVESNYDGFTPFLMIPCNLKELWEEGYGHFCREK